MNAIGLLVDQLWPQYRCDFPAILRQWRRRVSCGSKREFIAESPPSRTQRKRRTNNKDDDDDDVVVRFRFRDQLCQTGKLPINYRCGDASERAPSSLLRALSS